MMLIVSKRPNGGYRGRFHEKAKTLVLSGTRVGMVWLSEEDGTYFCHVCQKHHPKPEFEVNQPDHMADCPGCKTPFIFAKV